MDPFDKWWIQRATCALDTVPKRLMAKPTSWAAVPVSTNSDSFVEYSGSIAAHVLQGFEYIDIVDYSHL